MFKRIEETILVSLFLFALLALTLQIVSRYIFPYPLAWTEELARFLFTWIVFLGSAYILRDGGHVSINILIKRLPNKIQLGTVITLQIAVLIFLCILSWVGWQLAFKVNPLPTIAMGISSSWEYSAVPVAASIMSFRTVHTIIDIWRNGVPQSEGKARL